jgi:hypothetical protein
MVWSWPIAICQWLHSDMINAHALLSQSQIIMVQFYVYAKLNIDSLITARCCGPYLANLHQSHTPAATPAKYPTPRPPATVRMTHSRTVRDVCGPSHTRLSLLCCLEVVSVRVGRRLLCLKQKMNPRTTLPDHTTNVPWSICTDLTPEPRSRLALAQSYESLGPIRLLLPTSRIGVCEPVAPAAAARSIHHVPLCCVDWSRWGRLALLALGGTAPSGTCPSTNIIACALMEHYMMTVIRYIFHNYHNKSFHRSTSVYLLMT